MRGVGGAVGSGSATQGMDLANDRVGRMGRRRCDPWLLPAGARDGGVTVSVAGRRLLPVVPRRSVPGVGVVSDRILEAVACPPCPGRADYRRRAVRGVLGDRPTECV